ncbi:MAG: transcriptional repressor [Nitrospirota bacterium]
MITKETISAKIRKTKQREIILDVLKGTNIHPTADWIYEKVRQKMPNISLGTVYRNLKILRDMGELIEMDCGGAFSRFDANIKPHYHFTCQMCGKIMDIEEPVHHEIEATIARKTGFEITHYCMGFFGKCSNCREAAAAS